MAKIIATVLVITASFAAGNFAYQALNEGLYAVAVERTFFQFGLALTIVVALWFNRKKFRVGSS